MKNHAFQNVLAFIDVFYRYHYIRDSYTQITCDVMCVQYVVQQFLNSLGQKKSFLKRVFF